MLVWHRKQRKSRLAPDQVPAVSTAGKAGEGNSRKRRGSAMTRTGSSTLSNCRKAGMGGILGLWDSPPMKSSRQLQQVHPLCSVNIVTLSLCGMLDQCRS